MVTKLNHLNTKVFYHKSHVITALVLFRKKNILNYDEFLSLSSIDGFKMSSLRQCRHFVHLYIYTLYIYINFCLLYLILKALNGFFFLYRRSFNTQGRVDELSSC